MRASGVSLLLMENATQTAAFRASMSVPESALHHVWLLKGRRGVGACPAALWRGYYLDGKADWEIIHRSQAFSSRHAANARANVLALPASRWEAAGGTGFRAQLKKLRTRSRSQP